jgi:hypothetical protein
MNLPNTLTKCAPCAQNGLTRMAIEVVDDTPMCGPCTYDTHQHRLLADLSVDEPARVPVRRRGTPVPAMTRGLIPEAVEKA